MAGEENVPKRNGKIAFSIILIIGALFLVLNGIQIGLVSFTVTNTARDSYEADCQEITAAYSLALTNKISTYLKEVRVYVQSDVVQTGDEKEVIKWISDKASRRTPEFNQVGFCTPDGTVWYDTGTSETINSTPYFKAMITDGKFQYVDNPVVDPITEKAVIHICHLVRVRGKTLGFFVATVNLDMVQKIVGNIVLGETGNAMLLSGEGVVIEHQNPSMVMKTNLLKSSNKDLSSVASSMCLGESGSAWVKGLDGKDEFITYSPVSNTPWSFAFTVSSSQMNQTGTGIMMVMIGSAIVILIALIAISGGLIFFKLKPLRVVEQTINGIADGNADLTRRIEIDSDNEIGNLVKGFNRFTEKLHTIMYQLKNSKTSLLAAGDNLHSSMDDTVSSISQILDNIEGMHRRIEEQAAGVEETAGTVNQISDNIVRLEQMIETQAAGVTEASAAVQEMIGNIGSVNSSVEKMAASFALLEDNASSGAEKQKGVNEKISSIEEESKMLQEANSAIASIASQTNLLAMNAAIEAAHAGDAGKGFSVVADEIRKLSETSTVQSKTIGQELKKIKESISDVVAASVESSKAFELVAMGIRNTDELVKQIKSAMEEQQIGSKQISDALHQMNDSTMEVRSASSEMAEGNKMILEEMNSLQSSTAVMKESMNDMHSGASQITHTGEQLAEISSKLKDSIAVISEQIDLFKV